MEKELISMPYIVHESDMDDADRKNKRLIILVGRLIGFIASSYLILLLRRR